MDSLRHEPVARRPRVGDPRPPKPRWSACWRATSGARLAGRRASRCPALCFSAAAWRHRGGGARGCLELRSAPWWCFGRHRGSPGGGVAEVADLASRWSMCEWRRVVQSGEGPRRLTVAMMAALLRRRSPCWGHHGEALRSRYRGLPR
jgi:hypothetical protein